MFDYPYTKMRSVPSRRLHITDRLQVRGVSSEEEMAEEFEEDVMDPSLTLILMSCCARLSRSR